MLPGSLGSMGVVDMQNACVSARWMSVRVTMLAPTATDILTFFLWLNDLIVSNSVILFFVRIICAQR